MFKVNFADSIFPNYHFFKIFKTKLEADAFVKTLGSRFISVQSI